MRFFLLLAILAAFFCVFFCAFPSSSAAGSSILLVYRDDIPFYREIATKLTRKSEYEITLCALKDWPACTKFHSCSYVLVFGDLAYKKVLEQPIKNSKIFAFFVTKCIRKGRNIFCYPLFPPLREVLRVLKKRFENAHFLVLYTPRTKWWIKNFPSSSSVSFFCLNVKDLRESLRKAFKSKAKIYILAPDLFFMHRVFLKDVVRYSFIFSKILVGLSLKMQQFGVPFIIYYDYDSFWSNFDLNSLFSQKIDIPLRLSVAPWYSTN